jgi:hypothetical protein
VITIIKRKIEARGPVAEKVRERQTKTPLGPLEQQKTVRGN